MLPAVRGIIYIPETLWLHLSVLIRNSVGNLNVSPFNAQNPLNRELEECLNCG